MKPQISPADMCFGWELKFPLNLLRETSPQELKFLENNIIKGEIKFNT